MRLSLVAVAVLGALTVDAAVVSSRNWGYEHLARDTASQSRPPRQRVPPSHVVHERRQPRNTDGWKRADRADPVAILPIRIGLTQSNLDLGHDLLMNM